MGSSTTAKKHKKDKKHKHHRSTSVSEDVSFDHTYEQEELARRHHKHKKHKEHKERHRHKHRERGEKRTEVIALAETDSDSSDCVEVPIDTPQLKVQRSVGKEAPTDIDRERRDRERIKVKEREHLKERDRERYERDRELERKRDKERERERIERDRERERYERDREIERTRERDAEKERNERERERERERAERVKERDRSERERRHYHKERPERSEKAERDREKGRSRTASPIPDNGVGDCLSVEETNKLRAKLGLKPLEVDTGPTNSASSSAAVAQSKKVPGEKDLSSYKDEWGEFLHKPADNLKEKAEAVKIREKLKQHKEKRFLENRLARVRTLGESDEEVDDVSKWLDRNKRVADQRKEAEMRAKALNDMDAEFGVDELVEKEKKESRRQAYNDKHLKGLRVEHDMDDFSEGRTVILTLKDKDVLDDAEGDTLINVNMIDDERFRKNVENKKKNPLSYGYNVYEEQYDELGNPIERGVLEKYDEDVDGNAKKKNFVIGESLEEEREHRRKLLEIKTKLAGKRLETLADTKIQLASDTFSEIELAKFKKPKKKVKKQRQKLKAEDLLPLGGTSNEQHFGSRQTRRRIVDEEDDVDTKDIKVDTNQQLKIEEEDEDDLQRVLAKARKLKQKENLIQKSLPIDVAELKQEIKLESADENDDNDLVRGPDGNIVLNATAEFCRTLGDIPTYGMAGNRNEDSNDMMDFEAHEANDDRLGARYEEPELNHGTWNSVNPDEVMQPADLDGIADGVEDVAILDEEPDVGAGVANALRLALSKGYLEKEEHNRPSNSKMAHLQAKNYSIEDKSAGDDEKFGRRDRFHAGPIMDFKDKETFKPNVKLEYIDDNGRILNLKEAFRYLSHKFHGKGPGKNKIEKRLKKMEQDGLMKTMSSTDTPLGTLTMLQQKQKETKTPYVVLSGGKQTAVSAASAATISKYK